MKKMFRGIFSEQRKNGATALLLIAAFAVCLYGETKWYQLAGGRKSTTVSSHAATSKKTAYLTFDDGPSQNTEKVLEILEKEGAVATFFMIGSQIDEDTIPYLKRMQEGGSYIAIHTYTHRAEEIYASAESYEADVMKTADRIEEVTGSRPAYYRFPWGSVNIYVKGYNDAVIRFLAKKGLTHVDWNVSGEDSVGCPTRDSILASIKKDCEKYDEPVILMHDSCINDETVAALPDIIAYLKEMGYGFGTIDERSEPCQSKH